MRRRFWKIALPLAFLSLMLAPAATAGVIGNLLVASTTPDDGVTGYAYDPATGRLYTSINYGSSISGPGGTFDVFATGSLLDLAFANGFIWAGEGNAAGGVSLARIDPANGNVLNEYDLGMETLGPTGAGTTIPFMASGVAFDGTGLWISDNAYSSDDLGAGIEGTSVARFIWNPGLDQVTMTSGSLFTPWADTFDSLGVVTAAGRTPGGLAWNAGRLMIGTDSGQIYSYNPANPGGGLSLFATTADGGFVQGLESTPEPASFLLLGSGLLGCVAISRRRRAG